MRNFLKVVVFSLVVVAFFGLYSNYGVPRIEPAPPRNRSAHTHHSLEDLQGTSAKFVRVQHAMHRHKRREIRPHPVQLAKKRVRSHVARVPVMSSPPPPPPDLAQHKLDLPARVGSDRLKVKR